MAELDATAVVRRHLDAFNAGDLDALMAGFTDDAVWITGTTAVRGRADLTAFFSAAISELAPALTVQDLFADGDRAACQMNETLTVRGEARTVSIAAFYQLRDGRIASAKVYREGSAIAD
jgi:uncharacterized protein